MRKPIEVTRGSITAALAEAHSDREVNLSMFMSPKAIEMLNKALKHEFEKQLPYVKSYKAYRRKKKSAVKQFNSKYIR
jgi:hypothetical protein